LLAYGIIIAAFSVIELIFIDGLWRPFDIASYYGLADPAAKTIEEFLDFGDRTPAVLLNTGFSSAGRMLIVGVLCLACAILVMEAGRRLYGNAPGLLAGLLFTLNIAWAQGYMTLGESIALTLALFSVLSLLCAERNYIVSGLCAGAAACFMPLTLMLIPVSLLFMRNRRERGGILAYAAWTLLPLLLIWMGVLIAYGNDTPAMAMGSGFTAIGFLVQGEGYRTADAFMAIADIVLSACFLTSFLPLALLGFPGQKTGEIEKYLLVSGLLFLASLALGLYMHYWFFAMPFFALLCAKAYRVRLVESEALTTVPSEAYLAGDLNVMFK
jgi:uncharacterized membrane protein (UPF0136 family)